MDFNSVRTSYGMFTPNWCGSFGTRSCSSLFCSFPPAWIPATLHRTWHMYSVKKAFLLFNSFFGTCVFDLILHSFTISSLISIPIYGNSLVENAMACFTCFILANQVSRNRKRKKKSLL